MSSLAAVTGKIESDATRMLFEALRAGPSPGAVARLLGASRAVRIWRERVHFPASRPVQMALIVTRDDGTPVRIWVEWLGEKAQSHARAERLSLRKSRRGQIIEAPSGGIVADTENGFVLRYSGLDSKLPGLRLLYDPQTVSDLIGRMEGHGLTPDDLRVTLVAHRLGKRAVLRIDGPGGYLRYARLRATKSRSGARHFESHTSLWQTLGQNPALRVPEPVGFDPGLGVAVFKPLDGTAPDFSGLQGYRACRDILNAMNALQALRISASLHSVRDEANLLAEWTGRLRGYAPDFGPATSQAFGALSEDMENMPAPRPSPCHRDLHEKQILVSERGGAGLLDFDTLRLGDPALDIGNLQAHLFLAGLRLNRRKATFEDALLCGADDGFAQRAALWRRAALLRLAMIYAFTDEPRMTIRALLDEAMAGRSGWHSFSNP